MKAYILFVLTILGIVTVEIVRKGKTISTEYYPYIKAEEILDKYKEHFGNKVFSITTIIDGNVSEVIVTHLTA